MNNKPIYIITDEEIIDWKTLNEETKCKLI